MSKYARQYCSRHGQIADGCGHCAICYQEHAKDRELENAPTCAPPPPVIDRSSLTSNVEGYVIATGCNCGCDRCRNYALCPDTGCLACKDWCEFRKKIPLKQVSYDYDAAYRRMGWRDQAHYMEQFRGGSWMGSSVFKCC